MAEELLALREQMVAEASCSICLELFREPVLTACGHSFCGQCLARVLGDPPRRSPCPQCRAPVEPGSQRPIRSLGNVTRLTRSLGEVAAWPRCPQHGKPLALFCERCAALVCAFCRDGPEHRQHRVRPAEEAARELRETLQSNLLFLQNQKEKSNCREDQKSEDLLMRVMWELQPVIETFEELQQWMEEQKKTLQAELEQMSQELVNKIEEYKCRVLERQSLLDSVIAEIQEKRDQPAVEFLKDVGRILSSCEAAKAPIPEPVSPELQRSIESLSQKSKQVVDIVDTFRVNLWSVIGWGIREQVMLDPETANDYLILSWDRRTVWLGAVKQNVLDTPKRFMHTHSVLGTKGFTSGRHYWEVEVGVKGCWAVGVALESVPRKEPLNLHRSEKVWALQVNGWGQYRAVCMTSEVLALSGRLQRIMVCLDYEAGQVTFYNAKDMRPILQLEATFTEKVFPYFWISSGDSLIWLCD
ncbi:E3 ubiquitin-protein ligase TRIM7-like isoform X2 [Serinus canaria]|uniref:E3 ubiquitin-protein ligase TRIM7-like isoform X2 n=1 Tax=Serinus canaria TaxID=9135 RepID=UPI0021CC9508|nr:E3 ubiquitin-protein ligase TRIM7-like isoform X2 [Serinus canaria]